MISTAPGAPYPAWVAVRWREAWTAAAYGPDGFYTRGEAPADHFRTSVHASPLFAEAVGTLLDRVDAALGRPDPLDLVDVGAGRGELLAAVAAADRPYRRRLRLLAVEVGPLARPGVGTVRDVADLPPVTGLLVANEWLDDVPLDVVEQTRDGPRLVLVDVDGRESLGPPPDPADRAWLHRWWPLAEPGDRAEIGRSRDDAWAAAIGRIERGVAVAIDYGHEAAARPVAGRWPATGPAPGSHRSRTAAATSPRTSRWTRSPPPAAPPGPATPAWTISAPRCSASASIRAGRRCTGPRPTRRDTYGHWPGPARRPS